MITYSIVYMFTVKTPDGSDGAATTYWTEFAPRELLSAQGIDTRRISAHAFDVPLDVQPPTDLATAEQGLSWLTSSIAHRAVVVPRHSASDQLDWSESGTLWPVLCGVREPDSVLPVDTAVSWDGACVIADEWAGVETALGILALVWARLRTLKYSVADAQAFVTALMNSPDLASTDLDATLRLRHQTLADSVRLEPMLNRSHSWELSLVERIYAAWRLEATERTAMQAIEATAALYREQSEHVMRTEAARQRQANLRVQRILSYVTIATSASAITAVLDFSGTSEPWGFENLPRWLLSALTITGVAVAAVLLAKVDRSVRRHRREGGGQAGGVIGRKRP